MDREILERLLKNALKRQTIVFIYNDTTRKDERYTGFVYLLTKDYVVLRKVSSESRAAGYVVMTLSTIFRVDDGGQIARRTEKLYALHAERHQGLELPMFGDLFVNMLRLALAQKIPLGIYLDQDDEREMLEGYVRHFVDNHVVFEDLDENAESYGEVHFELAAILDIQMGTRDLANVAMLYENK
ncbi:hypothetical protein [Listeria booriae]|uniref:hypothetical protein n=1 Tax=Listeria booriae TaxID=1552123 RepID=UPI0016256C2C|nr:hypothetical protein [Listeria booriae]MBC1357763.1 hypothetical protein [Listeria booriae]